jgi:hypothetical protein
MALVRKDIFQTLRQYFYPKEFRIPESDSYTEVRSLIEELKKLQEMASAKKGPNDETIIRLADNIWRSQKGLSTFIGQDKSSGLERILRLLKETQDIFKETNIQVQDFTGERYVEGMVLKRLAWQPCTEEIRKNCRISRLCNSEKSSNGWIIETIKPAIYRDNHLIRIGEVIVCQPEKT